MIHHPVLLLAKLVLAGILVAVLSALYSVLSPDAFLLAVAVAIVVFFAGVLALWVLGARFMARSNSRLARGLVLPDVDSEAERAAAAEKRRTAWVGRRGTAWSALRPSGTADFDGQRLSVVAEGEFIPARSPVCIVAVEGARIVVRTDDAPAADEAAGQAD